MILLLNSIALIIGSILGGLLAVYIFRYFYAPLKEGLALQKMKAEE